MQRIRGEVFSLVFEPIVNMVTNRVVGYEGLSRCANSAVDPESFFKALSAREHLDLLSCQLRKFQKWVAQHPEIYRGKQLYLNINKALLLEPELLTLFIPFYRYFPINLELEPVTSLSAAHHLAIKRIFGELGIPLWVDDYAGHDLSAMSSVCRGVKLDRHYFWSLFAARCTPHFSGGLFDKARFICEGIETEAHKCAALALGATLGQGYLWPAVGQG